MNRKEFIIRCSNENTRLVENIVLPYHSSGLRRKKLDIDKSNKEFNEIRIKCSKRLLNDCRNALRQMRNNGLVMTTVEIW